MKVSCLRTYLCLFWKSVLISASCSVTWQCHQILQRSAIKKLELYIYLYNLYVYIYTYHSSASPILTEVALESSLVKEMLEDESFKTISSLFMYLSLHGKGEYLSVIIYCKGSCTVTDKIIVTLKGVRLSEKLCTEIWPQ